MKIKNLAIITLMITFLIILGTTAYATIGEVNSKEVKLRKKPDESSSILDYIYKGDEVEILEEEGDWYKVKVKTSIGKVTGYVSKDVVDVQNENSQDNIQEPDDVESNETIPTDTVIETPQVTVSNNIEENNQYTLIQEIGVKALPLINSREKAKITGNITVIEIINNWARIENDTESGWIRKNILINILTTNEVTVPESEQPVEEQPAEEIPEEPVQEEHLENKEIEINKTGYVSTDGLRVRKGPSTDTEAIDSLEKNDKVEIIGQIDNWYKIDLNGEIGYVSAKYISDTKIAETTSRGGSTLKDETAVKTEETTKQEETEIEEPKVEEKPEEPSTLGTTGSAIVEYAKQYLGYKYVSGGASPSKGFDCSGFTQYVYKHFGISLYRSSKDQIKNGVAIEKSDLQPGDLVIFNNDANTAIGHVGIYVGDGNFIHASNPSDGVKITTLLSGYYKIRYVGARRVF
ncbi:MAG: SH3 domain-containing protein [Clostridia bacterium]|nr:SH3 domain-containing protein [Clostridia bacterium]